MNPVLNFEIAKGPPKWRSLLIVGRVSNLPTVWSNCLVGWWLGGGTQGWTLALVTAAMTFLYVGGMFLNDAFDADFDRRHRKLRPIPSGAMEEKEVWNLGLCWLVIGASGCMVFGGVAAALALALVVCIVVYNATHKSISFGPLLMGACRLLVYLTAAAAGGAVTGRVIWPAVAAALYVAGLSWLARKETGTARPPLWPACLLAAPVALQALLGGSGRGIEVTLGAASAIWTVWALSQTFGSNFPRIGFTVSRLLAGIVLIDMMFFGRMESGLLWGFPACFATALFLQRFVPAT